MLLATSSPPAVSYGAAPDGAPLAVVLLHGRDRTPGEMIDLAKDIALPDLAWQALEAPGRTWYPMSFLEPIEANQPQLDDALAQVDEAVRGLEALGLPRRRIALVGFSQGAVMACEYVRRHPTRWGALIAFTGGLPGPEGATWRDAGGLDGTPVLLSNSDADGWVPWERTEQTARVFERMGGAVTLELCTGREHVVSDHEIDLARTILKDRR
jgi:predicted esterase